MRIAALTALVMLAFAANSLLNRAAVGSGAITPMAFALVRVIAGALMLALLARARPGRCNLIPALWLSLYLVGFSLAYLALDAGVGALILFAGVQATMLAGAMIRGETVPPHRLVGGGAAMAGLAALLWPGTGAVPALAPALWMAAAALGWGLYSLAGRGAAAPLRATAANFALAVPMVALAALPFGLEGTVRGIALAVLAGGVTSGLGYALWYAVMPGLGAARAAVVQLTVPVIAVAGGALVLGETPSLGAALAGGAVLAGVALAVWPAPVRAGS
ncbi:MAG: DMT family transporter [Pararhodobacter sp.]